MRYLTALELAFELRRVAGEQKMYRLNTIAALNQAADRLERYNELFKWSNENCKECADGRQIIHAQPLPDPDSAPEPSPETKPVGPNFRHPPGGGTACGWCGFAIVAAGPRQCCPEGIAWDNGSTYLKSELAPKAPIDRFSTGGGHGHKI